jgi:hypothetical protein
MLSANSAALSAHLTNRHGIASSHDSHGSSVSVWASEENAETELKLDHSTFCGTKHPQKLRELYIN